MVRSTKYIILALIVSCCSYLNGQNLVSTQAEYDSLYAINIKLTKINDVYIPKDLEDAHRRILKLTPASSIKKFKMGEELSVCEKLHFGIGRWMIYNWNFYDGSRLSHFLKQKGLLHPDDMAQFILRTLHKHLNKKEIDEKEIVEYLADKRKKAMEKKRNR
ncbi:MAG: hypothetical protein HKO66_00685 [Saprospiraceae bacterium]|nr:hypothetical protein [Bacteroidia bacterium]NNL90722.1 hypothetical protein [Saprospiraceae bacterium]